MTITCHRQNPSLIPAIPPTIIGAFLTATPAFTTSALLDPARNEPFELGRVQWIRRFGDGGREALACGYWHVHPAEAPEPFDLLLEADETIHILEGHLRIEVEHGGTYDLPAGGSASFNKGARTRWTVLAPTVEFFVYS
jgi:uncharacterized cupin superfamily protein